MSTEDKKIEKISRPQNANLTPGGPGRPKGRLNDATIYAKAIENLAMLEGKEPDEIDREIIEKGLEEAKKGNYSFYKDYIDRRHGPVVQRSENVNLNMKHELPEEDKQKLDDLIK